MRRLKEDFEDLDQENIVKMPKDPDEIAEELEPIVDECFSSDDYYNEGLLDFKVWKAMSKEDVDYHAVIVITEGLIDTIDMPKSGSVVLDRYYARKDIESTIEDILVNDILAKRLEEVGYKVVFEYVNDSSEYEDAIDISIGLSDI